MKENFFTLKEIVEKVGTTSRNIKFWCNYYNLKPVKKGRNNYYSEKLFQILKIINLLSSSKYFTQKFIKIIVEYNFIKKKDSLKSYKGFLSNINKFLKKAEELQSLNLNFFDKQKIKFEEKEIFSDDAEYYVANNNKKDDFLL